MTPEALAQSKAFVHGECYFGNGFFWEAHEVWEAVWLACPANSAEKRFVQAKIQLSNAELKLLMGRPKACLRLCSIARELLGEAALSGRTTILGVVVDEVAHAIHACERKAGIVQNNA